MSFKGQACIGGRHAATVVGYCRQYTVVSFSRYFDFQMTADTHGGKGIVDDIEKNLLQLAAISLKFREIFGQIDVDADVAILRFFMQEAEDLVDDFTELHLFDNTVHVTGKTEQSFGYPAAAFDRGQHRVQELDYPRILWTGVGVDEDILDKPGLLIDDGQRIVDFMGDARGQAADRCQLVGIFHLMQGAEAPLVKKKHAVDHIGGEAEDGEKDNYIDGMRALKEIGYQHYVSFECGSQGPREQTVPAAVALLREQWKKA